MPRPRKVRARARRDANHSEIANTFLGLGCSWFDTCNIEGALDGVVGVAGIDQRVEIKDGKKKPSERTLTVAERETFEEWRGRKPVVIESVDEAIALVNHLRATIKS